MTDVAQEQDQQSVDVFVSYSHEDEALRRELETHLTSLKRQGHIRSWHDRQVAAGQNWADEIDSHIESADLILLLISPAFLASDYCWGVEVERALERHENGDARVIPVVLRPVDWVTAPFSKLQALPQDGKPVTTWQDRDMAYLSVVQGLRAAVEEPIRRRARLSTLLKSLAVKRFSVFEETHVDFCSNLNVFIGLNATGKSHFMKLAYSLLEGWASTLREGITNGVSASLTRKLAGVFQPEGGQVSRLVRRSRDSAEVNLEYGHSRLSLRLSSGGESELRPPIPGTSPAAATFIPTREVLSMYEGFVAAYESRELSFDETYFDLCVAMSARPLRSEHASELKALLGPLEEILGGRVELVGNRFYVGSGKDRTEAHLLAEGMRKIAVLAHLIRNGSLASNSVLFWDEPESNLNPYLITQVAKTIRKLAGAGTQIVIATHDYLLAHELSLLAEYPSEPPIETRFFSFFHAADGSVSVEAASTLVGIDHNQILEEYASFHEREQELFHHSLGQRSSRKS
jgi:energy-coupling factor transporter ATP-binding protein EcfA2